MRCLGFGLIAGVSVLTATAWARVPTHVACVGDSITFGHGDGVADGGTPLGPYPKQLSMLFAARGESVDVQNFGHSGATLLSTGNLPYIQQPEYTAATAFVSDAGAGSTVDVIIMLGTNDSKPANWDAGAGQFRADYLALVDHFLRLSTRPVVYVAIPPAAFKNTFTIDGTTLHGTIDPLIEAVATATNSPLIDVYTPTANHPELFGDGVHPTDVGYTLVAETMLAGLDALLPEVDAGSAPDGTVSGPDASLDATVDGAELTDARPPADDVLDSGVDRMATDSSSSGDAGAEEVDSGGAHAGGSALDAGVEASGDSSGSAGGCAIVPAATPASLWQAGWLALAVFSVRRRRRVRSCAR